MAYTGYKKWTELLKVVNGGPHDGEALDINNNLVSVSGLPQASKPNVDTDPDYIEPVYDTTLCPPLCDLTLEFFSKTDETTAGANDGTVTLTGSTTRLGGFKVSLDNGATFPYTPTTSPYTITGLAPGAYAMIASNVDGSCYPTPGAAIGFNIVSA